MENELAESADEKAYFESGGAVAPEQPTEPAPAPAPQEQVQDPPKETKEVPKVPIHALHEARMENRELRDKLVRMEERFNQMLQRMQAPQEQKPPPSWDEAPVEAGKYTAQQVETVAERLARLEQERQAEEGHRAFMARYAASAQEFSSQNSDFRDAYNYWTAHMAGELQEAGVTDPAQIAQEIQNFERSIVAKAFQDGVNPAQRLYNIAKRRGYSSKTPEQIAQQKIETIEKGQQAAKSLSQAGGANEAPLSPEALAEMDDDDFDRNWNKVMRQANRRR